MTADTLCPEVRNGLHTWFPTLAGYEMCADCGESSFDATDIVQSPTTYARARSTDPSTSHEAAASLDAPTIRASHSCVLMVMKDRWAVTQKDLEELVPEFSPARVRTAVSELVRLGLVNDTGRRETLASGRRAILWELTS